MVPLLWMSSSKLREAPTWGLAVVFGVHPNMFVGIAAYCKLVETAFSRRIGDWYSPTDETTNIGGIWKMTTIHKYEMCDNLPYIVHTITSNWKSVCVGVRQEENNEYSITLTSQRDTDLKKAQKWLECYY